MDDEESGRGSGMTISLKGSGCDSSCVWKGKIYSWEVTSLEIKNFLVCRSYS